MKRWLVFTLILALLFCGCAVQDTHESTSAPMDVTAAPTTVPPTTAAPETEPAPALLSGYYLLEKAYYGADIVSDTEIDEMKCYLRIDPDGTGLISMMGMDIELQWNENTIITPADTVSYILSDDLVTLDIDGLKMAFRYHGDTLPETHHATPPETHPATLPVGYFLVSSVGKDGDVSFYSYADPANGYLKLNEDGTGILSYDGVTQELTFDAEYVYWNGKLIPYIFHSAEMTGDDELLMLYFIEDDGESITSVALRPAEEPGE